MKAGGGKKRAPRRPRGGKKTPRGPTHDWDGIRVAYVTGSDTHRELCERFGCSQGELRRQIARGSWQAQRAQWRAENARKALDQAREEGLRQTTTGLKLVYGLKLQVARRLQQRLQETDYIPTVRDLDLLQRLELDLLGVGRKSGGIEVNVTIENRVEAVLARVQEERRQAIDAEFEVKGDETGAQPGGAEDLHRFLYGPAEEGDDDQVDDDGGGHDPGANGGRPRSART